MPLNQGTICKGCNKRVPWADTVTGLCDECIAEAAERQEVARGAMGDQVEGRGASPDDPAVDALLRRMGKLRGYSRTQMDIGERLATEAKEAIERGSEALGEANAIGDSLQRLFGVQDPEAAATALAIVDAQA